MDRLYVYNQDFQVIMKLLTNPQTVGVSAISFIMTRAFYFFSFASIHRISVPEPCEYRTSIKKTLIGTMRIPLQL